MTPDPANADAHVIAAFGSEWRRFDQTQLSPQEHQAAFEEYFAVFPWERLPPDACGFDLGCGTGRWAVKVAPRVGTLHCIDPSEALEVARAKLAAFRNCRFHRATVAALPLPDGSADFGYSLGVLHHIPDPAAGLAVCVAKLKPGAPFLLYLYYAFDNRPAWFRWLWRGSDGLRHLVARLPPRMRFWVCDGLAALVYWPLARLARGLEAMGASVANFPLAQYRRRAFYTMRTDALDRFGTRTERRYTRRQMEAMMGAAGLEEIRFSPNPPFWCAVGIRRR